MLKFTTMAACAAGKAEDTPSQLLGAKALTCDGKVLIYTQASAAIAANTACKIGTDGKAVLTGTGIACKTDYAIGAGKYGWVIYEMPVTAPSGS